MDSSVGDHPMRDAVPDLALQKQTNLHTAGKLSEFPKDVLADVEYATLPSSQHVGDPKPVHVEYANGHHHSDYRSESEKRETKSPLLEDLKTNNGTHVSDSFADHFHIQHPTVDLTELEITMAKFKHSVDKTEHEKPVPYNSFLPSGYCYDVRMRYHTELDAPKERRELHPEDPRRIFKIFQELCVAGLIDHKQFNEGFVIPNPLVNIPVRYAKESEIELVHEKKVYDRMRATRYMSAPELIELGGEHDSLYLNASTFSCALLSAGGAIDTARAVMSGKVKNAIAIIRPPGHHAESSRAMGFCIFDNVAIATKICQLDFPSICQKVLILDWDVHHGNGIQQAFYQNPNVLYISLHVHENGNFYPSGPYGDHLHCGAGAGLGKNINIPWPKKGMGDADYMFAFQHIVMPVASEFDPDLVMIAAGFDAAEGDQLGGCHVTPACYGQMTHMLMSLAKGRVVVCLEGGYNLRSISKSALAVTRTLVGETPDRVASANPSLAAIETVHMVAMHNSTYWPCLYPKDIPKAIIDDSAGDRMHDVIRYYQAAKYQEKYNMMNLNIFQEKLSKSFENQVMATPNFEQEIPLLVIFHDPPEMMEVPDPASGTLELHNTWLADGLKSYIDWAYRHGIAIIDVNVPKYLSDQDEDEGYSAANPRRRIADLEKLALYLWDNYIDCNDATEIFFIGVGTAYQAIVHLLNNRTQPFIHSTSGIVNFITSTIVAASDQVVYDNPKWYRSHSLNYISQNHIAWGVEQQSKKKHPKRYGNLVQSERDGLNDMLVAHRAEVEEWIAGRMRTRRTVVGVSVGGGGGGTGNVASAGGGFIGNVDMMGMVGGLGYPGPSSRSGAAYHPSIGGASSSGGVVGAGLGDY